MEDTKNVKYDNVVNNLNFKGFTEKDFDIFMALCVCMYNEHNEVKTIPYSQLMDMIGWSKRNKILLFHNKLEEIAQKITEVNFYMVSKNDEFYIFNLFTRLNGNYSKRILRVRVNPECEFVINDLVKNFTSFELKEYVSLKGKYSKLLYQNLKQYKKTGWWQVSLEELRNKFDISDNFPTMHIKTKILSPSVKALSNLKAFEDLEMVSLKADAKGHAITGYKFTWTPERTLSDVQKEIIENKDKKTEKQSNFNSFQQNEYDFDELEKTLLEASGKGYK